MEKTNKRKAKAVAIAAAAILALAGTIAYLADASGTIRNVFDNEHIRVQINETGVDKDNGDKPYTILPGTSESKDPTITVDTDTDAYVFAVVKDTINSHTKQGASQATKFVDYHIADGWTLLDEGGESSEFGPKTIKKYVDILNEKTTGDLVVNPKDPNTKIYYRIVHGNELADTNHDVEGHRFTFNVLTNDQISYPTTLTNEDMELLSGITTDENKALIFQTWAIQMEPFCPADEVASADPTTADQKQYAKDAWNQTTVVPTGVAVSQAQDLNTVKVGDTLPLTATVTPKNAVDKTVTWSSSDTTKATVDKNGVVTGVAAGEVTITATANGTTGVSDTYTVTVTTPGPTFGYAVQFHGYDTNTSTVTFWPAMGVNVVNEGRTCGSTHCIHNDSFEEIKANLATNPNCYDDCITNGCTRKVELNESEFNSTECGAAIKTAGDGGGMVYDGLTNEEAMWEKSGVNTVERPSYNDTLEKIKTYSNIPTTATMKLLSLSDVQSLTDAQRVIYNNSGVEGWWWLADRNEDRNYCAYGVYFDGSVRNYVIGGNGIAPGFSY